MPTRMSVAPFRAVRSPVALGALRASISSTLDWFAEAARAGALGEEMRSYFDAPSPAV